MHEKRDQGINMLTLLARAGLETEIEGKACKALAQDSRGDHIEG